MGYAVDPVRECRTVSSSHRTHWTILPYCSQCIRSYSYRKGHRQGLGQETNASACASSARLFQRQDRLSCFATVLQDSRACSSSPPCAYTCFQTYALLRLACIGSRTVAHVTPHSSAGSATRITETILRSRYPSTVEFVADRVCNARRKGRGRRAHDQRARRVVVFASRRANVCDVGL